MKQLQHSCEQIKNAIEQFEIRLIANTTVYEVQEFDMSEIANMNPDGKYALENSEYEVIDSSPSNDIEFEFINENNDLTLTVSDSDNNAAVMHQLDSYITMLETA